MKLPTVIIFDFNGVLVWGSHLHEQAWCEFVRRLRGSPLMQDEIILHMHGCTNRTVLEYVLSRDVATGEALLLGEGKEAIYREQRPHGSVVCHLSPGAVPFCWILYVNSLSLTPLLLALARGI